jgi:hypothetical protein
MIISKFRVKNFNFVVTDKGCIYRLENSTGKLHKCWSLFLEKNTLEERAEELVTEVECMMDALRKNPIYQDLQRIINQSEK